MSCKIYMVIDIITLVVLVCSAIVGWKKGAITQAVSIIAVICGVIACRLAGEEAASLLGNLLGADDPGQSAWSDWSVGLLANTLVFAGVWFVVWMAGKMVRRAMRIVHLKVVDSIGGALFLMGKWLLVISIALNLWIVIKPDSNPLESPRPWGQALNEATAGFAPWLWGILGLNQLDSSDVNKILPSNNSNRNS